MKNLYKIKDELYIIDNNSLVTENEIWAMCSFTGDILKKRNGQLAHKVILTTNKLLIKDGVQAIDNEFLEWFVNNSSCKFIEIDKGYRGVDLFNYKIIIPKEEAKQDLEKEMFELEQELDIPSHLRWHNSKPRQETLEEVAEKLFKYYSNNTALSEGDYDYLMDKEDFTGALIEVAKWQDQNSDKKYSESDMKEAFRGFKTGMSFERWFEQFSKLKNG